MPASAFEGRWLKKSCQMNVVVDVPKESDSVKKVIVKVCLLKRIKNLYDHRQYVCSVRRISEGTMPRTSSQFEFWGNLIRKTKWHEVLQIETFHEIKLR